MAANNLANFFTTAGGTISGALGFATTLAMNSREKNAASFALESQKIANDFAATEFERQQRLLVLQNQFAQAQAKSDSEERADQFKLVGLVGLFAILIIVVIVVAKRNQD